MMFDTSEAMHVIIHLDGAEAFVASAAKAVEAICWCAIRVAALLVVGRILAALIRVIGK